MPKKAHAALKKSARKKGLKGKRRGAYIYGTLNKIEESKRRKRKRRRGKRKRRKSKRKR